MPGISIPFSQIWKRGFFFPSGLQPYNIPPIAFSMLNKLHSILLFYNILFGPFVAITEKNPSLASPFFLSSDWSLRSIASTLFAPPSFTKYRLLLTGALYFSLFSAPGLPKQLSSSLEFLWRTPFLLKSFVNRERSGRHRLFCFSFIALDFF